jgi:hypothetical protein
MSEMSHHNLDLRRCGTAFDCRDRLPALASWMSDDALKLIPIWPGAHFTSGHIYFDLDHPARGPFVADGAERPIRDHTYTERDMVPEEVWAQLITWDRPLSTDEATAIAMTERALGDEAE